MKLHASSLTLLVVMIVTNYAPNITTNTQPSKVNFWIDYEQTEEACRAHMALVKLQADATVGKIDYTNRLVGNGDMSIMFMFERNDWLNKGLFTTCHPPGSPQR